VVCLIVSLPVVLAGAEGTVIKNQKNRKIDVQGRGDDKNFPVNP
jgi:hypothetical protein